MNFETPNKKAEVIRILLQGGSIAGGRLRDARHNPLMKLTPKQFDNFRHGKFSILRKHKAGYFVINKKLVRSLHGMCAHCDYSSRTLDTGKLFCSWYRKLCRIVCRNCPGIPILKEK